MLQCVAVCCSVVQCIVVWYSMVQYGAPRVVHRPRSRSPLHFDTGNIQQIRSEK